MSTTDDFRLRKKLDDITKPTRDLDPSDVPAAVNGQIAAIAALGRQHRHAIVVERAVDIQHPETWRYVCVQHAFNLIDLPDHVTRICRRHRNVNPGLKFAEFLAKGVLSRIEPDDVSEGDVVIYRSDGDVKHVGRMSCGNVVSKWGDYHLFRHGLLEVPAKYGNELEFYNPISQAEAVEAFLAFARVELGEDAVDALISRR